MGSKIYNLSVDDTSELALFEILINHNFYAMFYSKLLYFNYLTCVRYSNYYIEQAYNLSYVNLNNLYSMLRTSIIQENKKKKKREIVDDIKELDIDFNNIVNRFVNIDSYEDYNFFSLLFIKKLNISIINRCNFLEFIMNNENQIIKQFEDNKNFIKYDRNPNKFKSIFTLKMNNNLNVCKLIKKLEESKLYNQYADNKLNIADLSKYIKQDGRNKYNNKPYSWMDKRKKVYQDQDLTTLTYTYFMFDYKGKNKITEKLIENYNVLILNIM